MPAPARGRRPQHEPAPLHALGPLDQLPAELKLLVFSRLGARELSALCCSSSEMRKQTKSLWGRLFHQRWAGSRVSSCNLFSPLTAHGGAAEDWQARYGEMERAERTLLHSSEIEGVELQGRLPSELGHVLQPDIALSTSLACCVCSGSSYNALSVWTTRRALASVDRLHIWQLRTGRALPPIELPSDPSGRGTPIVRAHGSILYVAAAGAAQVVAYACEGEAPVASLELRAGT